MEEREHTTENGRRVKKKQRRLRICAGVSGREQERKRERESEGWKERERQSEKGGGVAFGGSTFNGAGWDDAFSGPAVASGHDAGLVQVGPGYHHLLQVLGEEEPTNQNAAQRESENNGLFTPTISGGSQICTIRQRRLAQR